LLALACVASAVLLLSSPGSARAYGDVFRFADLAARGGGAGRWFTGSPLDGYGCDVCHSAPLSVDRVVVQNLPDAYQLGVTYDLAVSWPATTLHATALVELTDALGHGAGSLSLPETLTAAESCQPLEQNTPAGIVLSAPDLPLSEGRQIVAMQDCGGNLLHWRWTAPTVDVGPVLFAGGVVAPDGHMDAAGDGVTRLFKSIGSPAQVRYQSAITGACSVRRIASGQAGVLGRCGFVCLLALCRRRRAQVISDRAA
jgi:hypothetical protein